MKREFVVDENGTARIKGEKKDLCRTCGKRLVVIGTTCSSCAADKVKEILSTAASPSEFRAHWHVDPVEGRRRREAGPFSTLLAEHDSRIDRRFEVLEWVKALPSRKGKS